MPGDDCPNLRLSDWLRYCRDAAIEVQDDGSEFDNLPSPWAEEVERIWPAT
jgi:hypothetical protein